MSDVTLDDLLHESEVEDEYGKLLADRELRQARKDGLIGWFDLRKGPHYTRQQVMDYFKLREKKPCRSAPDENRPLQVPEKSPASSNSDNTGSTGNGAARSGAIIGMTSKLEERAAKLLDAES